jgi:hypothetical protein
LQVLGSDEDETRAGEVDEWMTAHGAESDDGSLAPCSHLDLVGAGRDMIANDPFTGGLFVALVNRLPRHAATPLTALSKPLFVVRTIEPHWQNRGGLSSFASRSRGGPSLHLAQ